jgi:hypothetical protein
MRKLFACLVALWIAVVPSSASADPITLSAVPSSMSVTTGGMVTVSVLISGLGRPPAVGAFDLTLAFNSLLLAPTMVVFGPFLGDPSVFEALTAFDFSTPGAAEFAEVSLLTPDELNALQPATFLLATLSFVGLGNGPIGFSFASVRVDDAFGNKLDISVPEPATILLMGLGFLAMLILAARRKVL